MARRLGWTWGIVGALGAAVVGASCSAGSGGQGTGGSGANASTSPSATGSTGAFMGSGGGGGAGGSGPTHSCDAASCQAANGMCVNDVCTIVENPGNVDPTTKGLLDAGGSADASFKWLYPYDQTVFPRGLIPPTLQFGGGAPDAVKVHITFSTMDYTGYYGASNPGRVLMSDAVWKAIGLNAGPNDVVKVDVTKVSGGQAAGPATESWSIAQGSLRGTIYYETYGSALASVGIMRIDPGAKQPTVVKSGCGNVCHTASADGSTLVASTAFPFGSASYDLKNNAAVLNAQGNNAFTYGGIYPDGSFSISSTTYRTWIGNPSRVFDTHTGAQIPTPSWDNVVTNAGCPAFSPDGKWVAFNREDQNGGHTLATIQYDAATKTFHDLANLTTESSYPAWPAFTPDSKFVVYHAGSNQQFETDGGATGDLYMIDVATQAKARLDRLDGYSYLPANDPGLNFAPTVLPEAVGGYFWVVFTSHRSYGNTLPSKDNGDQNGKLWVAALDINAVDGQDASHPAFYLDGQEAGADNLRGFWVLPPCKQDNASCMTGDECCGGFCEPDAMGNLVCKTTGGGCSKEFEKCSTAADCCNPQDQCINGHCATPPPK